MAQRDLNAWRAGVRYESWRDNVDLLEPLRVRLVKAGPADPVTYGMFMEVGKRILAPRHRQYWDCVTVAACDDAREYNAGSYEIPDVVVAGYGAICLAKAKPMYIREYLAYVLCREGGGGNEDLDTVDMNTDEESGSADENDEEAEEEEEEDEEAAGVTVVDAALGICTDALDVYVDYIGALFVEALSSDASIRDVCLPLLRVASSKRVSAAALQRIVYACCATARVAGGILLDAVHGSLEPGVKDLWNLLAVMDTRLYVTALTGLAVIGQYDIATRLVDELKATTRTGIELPCSTWLYYIAHAPSDLITSRPMNSHFRVFLDMLKQEETDNPAGTDFVRYVAAYIRSGMATADPDADHLETLMRARMRSVVLQHDMVPEEWFAALARCGDSTTHQKFIVTLLTMPSEYESLTSGWPVKYLVSMMDTIHSDLLKAMATRFIRREWARDAIKMTKRVKWRPYMTPQMYKAWAAGKYVKPRQLHRNLVARRTRNCAILKECIECMMLDT